MREKGMVFTNLSCGRKRDLRYLTSQLSQESDDFPHRRLNFWVKVVPEVFLWNPDSHTLYFAIQAFGVMGNEDSSTVGVFRVVARD